MWTSFDPLPSLISDAHTTRKPHTPLLKSRLDFEVKNNSKHSVLSKEKEDTTQKKSFFRSAYILNGDIHSIRVSVRFEMSGNNTLEISCWEKKLYDRGMKNNEELVSVAVDALSALPSRGPSQFVFPLFLKCTLSLLAFQNTQGLSFIPFDKRTEGGSAENAQTATDMKSYSIEVWEYMHPLISGLLCTHVYL